MRRPEPWYRASKDAWFVEHNGKQVRLGKHPAGAPAPKKGKTGWNPPETILRAFHELMAEDPSTLPNPARLTVAELCNTFLTNICPYVEAPSGRPFAESRAFPAPPSRRTPRTRRSLTGGTATT